MSPAEISAALFQVSFSVKGTSLMRAGSRCALPLMPHPKLCAALGTMRLAMLFALGRHAARLLNARKRTRNTPPCFQWRGEFD